jgi:hypothetical protein
MKRLLLISAIASCFAALAAVGVDAAGATSGCTIRTYGYAGLGSRTVTRGVAATISANSTSTVYDGHVAGWIGVGGVGAGPGGTDEWIQIGLSAFQSDAKSRIYYEVKRPGKKAAYHEVRIGVRVGESHRFAVLELAQRPGWWRVFVDGVPASRPVHLPGSHGAWKAQALGESWSGNNSSGSCNEFSFAFNRVSLLDEKQPLWTAPRAFHLFQDRGYRFVQSARASFVAASASSLLREPTSR